MIISLFGPDGVGKSSLASLFAVNDFQVFSGTGVASWPDKSWINQLNARGVDETRVNEESHFLEKIKRAHELARSLENERNVVIDSDPFHKTLMHDLLKQAGNIDTNNTELRYEQLIELANIDSHYVHVHMQISENLSDEEQAKILYDRIRNRGELAPFDPETLEESVEMIHACKIIAGLLAADGHNVVTVNTADETDFEIIKSQIKF